MNKGFAIKPYDTRFRLVPVALTVLSFFLFAVTAAFFIENIAFFQPQWNALMDDTQFFISFAAALLGGILFLVMARRYYGIKFHPGFFLLFFTLFISGVAGIFLFPSSYTGTVYGTSTTFTLTFTSIEKIRYCLDFLIVCFLFYCQFAVLPKVFTSKRLLSFFHYLVVIAALVAIVWSLLYEWNIYVNYFDPSATFGSYRTKSFTNNPNTYGFFMMIAVLSCTYLQARNRAPIIWWLLIALFVSAMATTLSRTSVFATLLYLIFYFFYVVIRNAKHSPKRVILTVFFAVMLIVAFFTLKQVLPPDNVINRFVDGIFHRSLDSYSSRVDIWDSQIAILNADPIRYVFGVGEKQAWIITGKTFHLDYFCPSHNSYLNQLYTGGVIRVAIFMILLGYFFYKAINVKTRSKVIPVCVGCLIAMLIHGFGEDTSFLLGETKAFCIFILYMLPVFVEAHLEKEKAAVDAYIAEAKAPKRKVQYVYSPVTRARLAFAFITFPIVIILGGLAFLHQGGHLLRYTYLPLAFLGLGALIFFPGSIYVLGFYRKHSTRNALTVVYVLVYALLAVPAVLFPMQWFPIWIALATMFVLFLVPYMLKQRDIYDAKEKFWLKAFLPAAIVAAILFIPYPIIYYTTTNGATTYNLVAMMVAEAFLLALIYATPLGRKLIYPFPHKGLIADGKFMEAMYANEARLDAKDRIFYEGKPLPAATKKDTYYVHTGTAHRFNYPQNRKK